MTSTQIKVAIVDDDDSVRKALGRLLRSAGMASECFDSAESFLDSLANHQPDCVLVDVRMPGMNGLELLQRLEESGRQIPAIVISAHEHTVPPGAAAFLLKPLDDEVLLRTIRDLKSGNN